MTPIERTALIDKWAKHLNIQTLRSYTMNKDDLNNLLIEYERLTEGDQLKGFFIGFVLGMAAVGITIMLKVS